MGKDQRSFELRIGLVFYFFVKGDRRNNREGYRSAKKNY